MKAVHEGRLSVHRRLYALVVAMVIVHLQHVLSPSQFPATPPPSHTAAACAAAYAHTPPTSLPGRYLIHMPRHRTGKGGSTRSHSRYCFLRGSKYGYRVQCGTHRAWSSGCRGCSDVIRCECDRYTQTALCEMRFVCVPCASYREGCLYLYTQPSNSL